MELQQERKIKNGLERVLKQFKHYYLVPTIEESDLILIFDNKEIEHFNIYLNEEKIFNYIKNNEFEDNIKIYFLRNRNRRDAKKQAVKDILRRRFYRQN